MKHFIERILGICREVPLLPIVILAAIPLALIPTWRPWGNFEVPFDPGVGQWITIVLVIWTIIMSIQGIAEELKEGHVGVDLLAVVALASTVAVQQYWAAWVVMLMVASGEAIESYAQAKAKSSLTALLNAEPRQAHVVTLPGVNNGAASSAAMNNDAGNGSVDTADNGASAAQDDGFRKVNAETVDLTVSTLNMFNPQAADASHFTTVPVDQVKIGDTIVVLPGETVPVDGELLSGSATLDLSNINGEPVPRTVYAGADVMSGSVNGASTMMIRATRLAKDSQYQHILELVRSAQDSRAAVVRTADMLAVPFTVIALVIAAVAWIVSGTPMRFAQVLVLATPCPLLIAAPVAYVAGTGRLARHGILVKVQDALENLGRVNHIFFDKTGTLTVKQPQVVRIEKASSAPANMSAEDLLMMAGVVENYSVHILAKGIARAGRQTRERLSNMNERHSGSGKNLARRPNYPVVEHVAEAVGKGVAGEVDGHAVRVGRLAFVLDSSPIATSAEDRNKRALGHSSSARVNAQADSQNSPEHWPSELEPDEMATFVSVDGKLAARIVLRDIPRPDAKKAIARLKSMGITNLTMLTGDKEASAELIASEVGITDIRAQLLPQDKVNAVKQASIQDARAHMAWWDRITEKFVGESQSKPVTMMVGDGVNDAPVLAVADIGVAMTDGTSTAASQSAQVVIMDDSIAAVPEAIAIARHTKRVMLQAVITGIALAIVAMLCAAFNLIPVVVGALLQEGIDVISILWALTAMFDHDNA